MINRWQGNSGRVQRLPEKGDRPPERLSPPMHREPERARPAPRSQPAARQSRGLLSGLEGLKRLIPGKAEELETEDIILLLILYLMYRESGDQELLMIMGAMFLL